MVVGQVNRVETSRVREIVGRLFRGGRGASFDTALTGLLRMTSNYIRHGEQPPQGACRTTQTGHASRSAGPSANELT